MRTTRAQEYYRECRPKSRGLRNAHSERGGQGIAQNALHDAACQSQAHSGEHRRDNPRNTDIPDDDLAHLVTVTHKRIDDLTDSHLYRPYAYGRYSSGE